VEGAVAVTLETNTKGKVMSELRGFEFDDPPVLTENRSFINWGWNKAIEVVFKVCDSSLTPENKELFYEKLYNIQLEKNAKLLTEVAHYIGTALHYQTEFSTTLNTPITPHLTFRKLENIKLAAFVLAYKQNKKLGLKLAQVMGIDDLLPAELRKDHMDEVLAKAAEEEKLT
jgi:hypothetical protein